MRLTIALTIFATLLGSGVASAQRMVVSAPEGEPTPDDLSTARERFAAGTEAAEHGRWSDALGAFREAYQLSGISAALYNVGTTYRSLGRHVEARDTFEQLLREHPELSDDMKSTVEGLRNEVAARVAALELRGVPADGSFELRLDGRSTALPSERPVRLETEGGRHTVRLSEPRYEPFVWEGAVAEGDTRVVEVELVAIPEEGGAPPPSGMSTVGKVILISVIGLVVVGAAVTTGVLLAGDGLQPESGLVVEL
ncbi:MAG: tetratricopeptide repeat protein [Deltaproteobacteria bacterium]|nr:tetratricopeptide repeat protein [Deltaproteobacteria bacterium]